MTDTQSVRFHELARANGRGRAFGEVVLAAFFWLIFVGIIASIAEAATDVSPTKLDGFWGLVALCVGLGSMTPMAMLAARAVGRRAGTLSSVSGRFRWRLFAKLALLAVAVTSVHIALSLILDGATESWASAGFDWPGIETFAPLALLIVIAVPFQAAGEEYLFRGTLQQGIGAFARNPWIGIVLTAGLFAVVHGVRIEATVAIAMFGLVTGWLSVRTGGLEASVAIHAANNVLLFMMTAADGAAGTWLTNLNKEGDWAGTVIDCVSLLVYAALAARLVSAQGALTAADQVEQHAPERNPGVEHADDSGRAQPLAP
jgi:membrane protease YdiL (CAAX protease family)